MHIHTTQPKHWVLSTAKRSLNRFLSLKAIVLIQNDSETAAAKPFPLPPGTRDARAIWCGEGSDYDEHFAFETVI